MPGGLTLIDNRALPVSDHSTNVTNGFMRGARFLFAVAAPAHSCAGHEPAHNR
jgi:hypothetical protein